MKDMYPEVEQMSLEMAELKQGIELHFATNEGVGLMVKPVGSTPIRL